MASNDPAVFQEFQNALRTRDPKTIAMYLTTMRDFVVWLAAQPGGAPFHMELMTETAVCGYMASLKTAGRAPRTRSNAFHRKVNEAKVFYGSYAALVILAGGVVLIPNAPLGLMTFAVQALAGILLPSATVFLVLLCNDREVLGPWINRPWLNIVASIIVGLLVILSLVLTATVLFLILNDGNNAVVLSVLLGIILLVGLIVMGGISLVQRKRKG